MASSSRVTWAEQAIEDDDEIQSPANASETSAKLYERPYYDATPLIKALYDDPLNELHSALSGLSEINQRIKELNRVNDRSPSEGLIDIRFFYRMREELDREEIEPEIPETGRCSDQIFSKIKENFYPLDWCLEWPSEDDR
jgi:hypothetical protein